MSEFNKDELKPPAFVNETYFEEILRDAEKDEKLKLINLEITPGSKVGDHYASIIFKIHITYQNQEKLLLNRSWVLKTIPLEGNKQDFLTQVPAFTNEISMYTKILPRMEEILRDAGDNDEIGPRYIYHSIDPPVIILEDITNLGYRILYENLNFVEIQLMVDKIAKFHALSLIIENDIKLEDFSKSTVFKGEKIKNQLLQFLGPIKHLTEVLKTWPGFEEIQAKLEGSEERIIDGVFDVYGGKRPFGYCVLNHGDFHIRNMMFLKKEDNLKNVLFLDFQFPFWGTPAIDLIYLLHLIGDDTIYDRKEELFRNYHTKFCGYLRKFNYNKEPPSLLDLNLEYTKYSAVEVLLIVGFKPIFYYDYSEMDIVEIVELTGEAAKKYYETLFSNPKLVEILKRMLPILHNKGLLDWTT